MVLVPPDEPAAATVAVLVGGFCVDSKLPVNVCYASAASDVSVKVAASTKFGSCRLKIAPR